MGVGRRVRGGRGGDTRVVGGNGKRRKGGWDKFNPVFSFSRLVIRLETVGFYFVIVGSST